MSKNSKSGTFMRRITLKKLPMRNHFGVVLPEAEPFDYAKTLYSLLLGIGKEQEAQGLSDKDVLIRGRLQQTILDAIDKGELYLAEEQYVFLCGVLSNNTFSIATPEIAKFISDISNAETVEMAPVEDTV